jgi:protein CpxP
MQSFVKSSLLVLALGFGTLAFAQTTAAPTAAPTHKMDPAHELKRLSKELSLTADQQTQIGPILADRQQKMSALASNTTLDATGMKKQRHAIMLDSQQKINAVLTSAQQQQMAALRAAHHHKGATGAPSAAA